MYLNHEKQGQPGLGRINMETGEGGTCAGWTSVDGDRVMEEHQ
jgi:hypothetical protein